MNSKTYGGKEKLLANVANISMPVSEEDKLKFLTDTEANPSPSKQMKALNNVYPVSISSMYINIETHKI